MSHVARIIGVHAELQVAAPHRLKTHLRSELRRVGNVIESEKWHCTLIDPRNAAFIDPTPEEIREIDNTAGLLGGAIGARSVKEMVLPVLGVDRFGNFIGYEIESTERYLDILGTCQDIVMDNLGIDVRKHKENEPHVSLVRLYERKTQPLPNIKMPEQLHCRGYYVGRAVVSMAYSRGNHFNNRPPSVRSRQ